MTPVTYSAGQVLAGVMIACWLLLLFLLSVTELGYGLLFFAGSLIGAMIEHVQHEGQR